MYSENLAATGQGSDISFLVNGPQEHEIIRVSVSGTWVGQVNLTRKLPDGTYGVVKEYTANEEDMLYESPGRSVYRFDVVSYTSGTIKLQVWRGDVE